MRVAAHLWSRHIPFVLIDAYGLLGYVRIVHGVCIVRRAHGESLFTDFRLDQQFDREWTRAVLTLIII